LQSQRIPKLVHRIWLGSELPAEFSENTKAWKTSFPDYQLKTWNETSLIELGMPEPFFTGLTYAERSDVARYVVLHRFGGIYADCDALPLKRFDYLWAPSDTLICFQESDDLICNGAFAASPGNPALALITKLALRSARRHDSRAAPNVRTGPFVFTAGIDYYRNIDPSTTRVYPPGFIHVHHPREEFAVISSPFRYPPLWAHAKESETARPSSGPAASLRAGLHDAEFFVRYAPLRIRRRLRDLL
jgi:mannosyltransferase OCH1-like enzyme